MTTNRAKLLLRCSKLTLDRMAKDGRLRKTLTAKGKIDWNDHDVLTLSGMDPTAQLTVVYARVNNTDKPEERLENQKQRILQYCQGAGIKVDVIIGEIRRVGQMRNKNGDYAAGFNALMELLIERRVGKLIMETRDRFAVGIEWEMFEYIFRVVCGCEVVILNKHLLRDEYKAESKHWLQDMLTLHKVVTGEIRDKRILQQFMGGMDAQLGRSMAQTLDRKARLQKQEERGVNNKSRRYLKKPLDLGDMFDDSPADGQAYRPLRQRPQVTP